MGEQIFISYSRQDSEMVAALAAALHEHEVVYDEALSIDHGEVFFERIANAIEQASIVLVLWTESASRSEWVQYELDYMHAIAKRSNRGLRLLVVNPSPELAPSTLPQSACQIRTGPHVDEVVKAVRTALADGINGLESFPAINPQKLVVRTVVNGAEALWRVDWRDTGGPRVARLELCGPCVRPIDAVRLAWKKGASTDDGLLSVRLQVERGARKLPLFLNWVAVVIQPIVRPPCWQRLLAAHGLADVTKSPRRLRSDVSLLGLFAAGAGAVALGHRALAALPALLMLVFIAATISVLRLQLNWPQASAEAYRNATLGYGAILLAGWGTVTLASVRGGVVATVVSTFSVSLLIGCGAPMVRWMANTTGDSRAFASIVGGLAAGTFLGALFGSWIDVGAPRYQLSDTVPLRELLLSFTQVVVAIVVAIFAWRLAADAEHPVFGACVVAVLSVAIALFADVSANRKVVEVQAHRALRLWWLSALAMIVALLLALQGKESGARYPAEGLWVGAIIGITVVTIATLAQRMLTRARSGSRVAANAMFFALLLVGVALRFGFLNMKFKLAIYTSFAVGLMTAFAGTSQWFQRRPIET